MTKAVTFIISVVGLLPVGTHAQSLPIVDDDSVYPSSIVLNYRPAANSVYKRVLTPKKATTDSSQVTINSAIEDVHIVTDYFDQLGRPVQQVVKQGSPLKRDIVSPVYFDPFNRTPVKFYPYVQQTGRVNDGKFKDSMLVHDSVFYKSLFPNEPYYFAKVNTEASPFQRVLKVLPEGSNWLGANRGKSFNQRANAAGDSVRLWTIDITGEDDNPASSGYYLAGSLFVEEVTDEKGVVSMNFKDEFGRTVLTKSQLSSSPGNGHIGWLCTYYVYDEMGQLRMVIPPKGVEAFLVAGNWSFTSNPTIKTGLCYWYYYNDRGQVVMKYIPGKGKNYIAYDLLDRPVMTQDPNLRQTSQWAFVKYDEQFRASKSGLITSSLSKDDIIANASQSSDYPALSGTYTVTTETYYDDYGWISGGVPVTATLETTHITSGNFFTSYNASPEYAVAIEKSTRTRGAVTGMKKLVLGTSDYLYAIILYDEYGRPIQAKQSNYTTGVDVATTQYSFSGQILRTHLKHVKSGTNSQTHTVLTKYNYDHMGRVVTLMKKFNDLAEKSVTKNYYNELGQLRRKVIGDSIETQDLAYNIRGWLMGINKDYITASDSTSHYFGEALYYDSSFTTNLYDGAISGLRWRAAGDSRPRGYAFTYDNVNRLVSASFTQQNIASSAWTNDKVDYSVDGLSYDAGSNITSMRQKGLKLASSSTIDSLTYTYFSNSNQLQKVSDGITDASPLGDFKDTTLTADDYTYDVNGNITKDNNRKMHTPAGGSGAVYNLLDKPDSLVIAGKATIYYYYDASGVKHKKKINDYTSGTLVEKNYLYINGFVYLNDTLLYALHEEGRIRYAAKKNSQTGSAYYAYEYDYFLRDHLNNVRTVITEGKDTTAYQATMESADSLVVKATFSNVYDPSNTVEPKPVGFDTDNSNVKVSRLNGSTSVNKKTGPGIVLKVMAGDKIQISAYSFYNTAVQPPESGVSILSDVLNALSAGVVTNSGGKVGAGDGGGVSAAITDYVQEFLSDDRPYTTERPKAFLSWILVDNQFNYVASSSGAMQVESGSAKVAMAPSLQRMAKNGYLYVYVSNESAQDVYFDDLTVKHYTGPLLQEEAYYPFGLQMSAISDKAVNKQSTQYKFNGGVELEEDGGINLYSTFYRMYDPQLGRFSGVDILSETFASLSNYQYGLNNPVSFNDPLGDRSDLPKYVGNGNYQLSDGRRVGIYEVEMILQMQGAISKIYDGNESGELTDFTIGTNSRGASGFRIQYVYGGSEHGDEGVDLKTQYFVNHWTKFSSFNRPQFGGLGWGGMPRPSMPWVPDFQLNQQETVKVSVDVKTRAGKLGDRITLTTYEGYVRGKTGVIYNGITTANKKVESSSIHIGNANLWVNNNGTISFGLTGTNGTESHINIGWNSGFVIGLGASTTTGNHIYGFDANGTPGGGTLLVVGAVVLSRGSVGPALARELLKSALIGK